MRDSDFPSSVKKRLAQKAMYICSSTNCFRFTGYETTKGKVRSIAQAAHINAAGKSGPRATSGNETDLKSESNGIWLCSICHKQIDDDPDYYTEEVLRKWKKEHSQIIRNIVGKDLEAALLDLKNHKRNHEEAREFLSFIENKRVFYEGLDHEFPPRVLSSLSLIRERLIQTRAKVNADTELFLALKKIQNAIDVFFREIGKDTDLNSLQCNSSDPKWIKFSEELLKLRKGIVIIMKVVADDAGYTLSNF